MRLVHCLLRASAEINFGRRFLLTVRHIAANTPGTRRSVGLKGSCGTGKEKDTRGGGIGCRALRPLRRMLSLAGLQILAGTPPRVWASLQSLDVARRSGESDLLAKPRLVSNRRLRHTPIA